MHRFYVFMISNKPFRSSKKLLNNFVVLVISWGVGESLTVPGQTGAVLKENKNLNHRSQCFKVGFTSRASGAIYLEPLKHNIMKSAEGRHSVKGGWGPKLGPRFMIILPQAANFSRGREKGFLLVPFVVVEKQNSPCLSTIKLLLGLGLMEEQVCSGIGEQPKQLWHFMPT